MKFKVGEKVNILDPYDFSIANTGRGYSLYMIHGVPLGLEDANVNVIHVTNNIPLAYEDTIDGCEHLKETKMSFIRWPKKFLGKSSIYIITFYESVAKTLFSLHILHTI